MGSKQCCRAENQQYQAFQGPIEYPYTAYCKEKNHSGEMHVLPVSQGLILSLLRKLK